MPVTNNNYNFTNIVYEIPENAIVSGLHPTAVITIVPNSGYNATASNFSMDPGFSDPSVLSDSIYARWIKCVMYSNICD